MGGSEQVCSRSIHDIIGTPLGPNVNGLEKDLETYLGNVWLLYVVSCKLNLPQLDTFRTCFYWGTKWNGVICQSMTFDASADPIFVFGASCFVDSERDTWNICRCFERSHRGSH
jgi:dTDP-4-amino-4,6-dideoxygalactose transaminase